jgi:hypothetical protein
MNDQKNLKIALVIADKPTRDAQGALRDDDWKKFLTKILNANIPSEVNQTFHDNVWQLDLHKETPTLAKLVHEAAEAHISLRILFLDNKPDWINIVVPEKLNPESTRL